MKKLKIAIYPGSFDPVTNGHIDIIKRAACIFDEVIVAVVEKPIKSTLFTVSERTLLLHKALHSLRFQCPVKIEVFNGLLVKFAQQKKAATLVRGLRAISDFEYEFQMALMNRKQAPTIETVFLMPDEKFVYLSSSIVKIIGQLHGNLEAFLPGPVINALKNKFPLQ